MMSLRRNIVATLTCVVALAAMAEARIEWIETEHNFGVFREEMGKVSCQFKGINTGDEPLVILQVRANCGCTIPKYPSEPIAPGDTVTISATYNAQGRPGRFSKKVYVDANTTPKRMALTISGVVIGTEATLHSRFPLQEGELMYSNSIIPFGEIDKGKSKIEFFEAYNHSTDTITPVWHNLPKHLTVNSSPKSIPPGELLSYTIYYNTLLTSQWGATTDTIYISPTADSEKRCPVVVTASVVEDFSKLTPGERAKAPRIAISTESIDFGHIDRTTPLRGSFLIENYGDSPVQIRRIYSLDKGIDVTIDKDKIKKGKKSEITVTIDPTACPGDILNSRLIVITNDPDRPQAIVRLVGQFK